MKTPEELKVRVEAALKTFDEVPSHENRCALLRIVDDWSRAKMPRPEWLPTKTGQKLLLDGEEFAKIMFSKGGCGLYLRDKPREWCGQVFEATLIAEEAYRAEVRRRATAVSG